MLTSASSILALDVGGKRIGIAIAGMLARLPRPLMTIANDTHTGSRLQQIVKQESAGALVIGLPRGLNGQHTAQTRIVEQFAEELRGHLDLPIFWQDEAVTSQQAEAELHRRGKRFVKGDVDALAAVYILEDFLESHQEIKL